MATRGLKTEGIANTITFEKQINQTSVLKYRFIPTSENGNQYVGNMNDDNNDFRTFNVGGVIYADVSDSRWSQSMDTSPYFNHVISVEFSNSRCKWVDETDNVTIVDQQQTFYNGDFTIENCYIDGGNNWTFIDANLTTNGTLQFDLYVDNTGLYDRVSASYIQINGWENVSVDADPQPTPTPTPTPTPSWQKQADWAQTDSTQVDFIKNKPNLYEEWWGTQAEYDAILVKDPDIIYNIIYEEPQINYFYVEDISGSDNTLSITKSNGNAPTVEVFKSTDGTNWTSMGQTDTTPITATIPANSKLYLKATANAWANGDERYNNITATGNNNVGGNAMSLLYGDNFESQTAFPSGNTWCLSSILRLNTTLVSVSNLKLPATTLVERCYQNMLRDCTSLTAVPSNLLPATTLANICYAQMFYHCTSLTTAPVLPATTLVQNCYTDMFYSCTSLNSVTTYAQDISASGCLQNWLNSVAATGDFYNLGGATYTSGASGIPGGWTEHNSL